MLNRILGAAAAVLLAIVPSTAPRVQDDDILKNLINNPNVASWQVLGVNRPPRPQHAEGVLGERAIRIAARRSDQPWTVAAQMPVTGAVKQGDTVLLAVCARPDSDDGPVFDCHCASTITVSPEAEGRSGRGEGASGEADPGGGERALARRRRAREDAGAVPRGGEVGAGSQQPLERATVLQPQNVRFADGITRGANAPPRRGRQVEGEFRVGLRRHVAGVAIAVVVDARG